MADVIVMPKLGFNQEEGELIKWHKQQGDAVVKGEVLFEVNTDKTTMPVEATGNGILLRILVAEGDIVPVFTPIAVIGQAGENPDSALKGNIKPETQSVHNASAQADVAVVLSPTGQRHAAGETALRLSPKGQRLVKEQGLDLTLLCGIIGTGYDGGITARDIERSGVLETTKIRVTPVAHAMAVATGVDMGTLAGTGVDGKIVRADVEARLQQGDVPCTPESGGTQGAVSGMAAPRVLRKTPYTGVRKIIGDRLSSSMYTSPHLYFTDTVDVSALMAFREQVNETTNVKAAMSDLLIMAASRSLTAFPNINVALHDGEIFTYRSVNIGMAVAGKKGLIVPVVRDAQDKTLGAITAETRGLVERAKEGCLLPEEYSGGTFTISNLGMFGIENFTAIINPPEAAILAVGAIRKEPCVVLNKQGEDVLAIRPLMRVQLSVDHRLIDGLLAAQFMHHFKNLLEHPLSILL